MLCSLLTLSHSFFTGWHSSAACPRFSERSQASFPPQGSLSCILLLKLLASKRLTAKQQLLQHYLGHMTSGHHLSKCMLGKESLLVTCQKSPDSKSSGRHQEDLKKAEHRNCFMSCCVCKLYFSPGSHIWKWKMTISGFQIIAVWQSCIYVFH